MGVHREKEVRTILENTGTNTSCKDARSAETSCPSIALQEGEEIRTPPSRLPRHAQGEANQTEPMLVSNKEVRKRAMSFSTEIEIIAITPDNSPGISRTPVHDEELYPDMVAEDDSPLDSPLRKLKTLCDAVESRRAKKSVTPRAICNMDLPSPLRSELWRRRSSKSAEYSSEEQDPIMEAVHAALPLQQKMHSPSIY